MNRLIIFIIILFLAIDVSAQNTDVVNQNIGVRGFSNIKPKKIEMFTELPVRIQGLLTSFIANRFDSYSANNRFLNAQVFPIDSLFKSDYKELELRNTIVEPIPYYDLNYAFEDSSLGIQQYWINIGMDGLGQVLYCNFPYLGSNRKTINSLRSAKHYSDSMMISFNPMCDTTQYAVDLDYSIDDDVLIWQICYLTKAEDKRKDYDCLLINAHYNHLVSRQGMFEEHYSIEYNCCDVGMKIRLDE